MKGSDLAKPQKKQGNRLGRWIEHNIFRSDAYKEIGGYVVSVKHNSQKFRIQDVFSWQQIFICFGVPFVNIKLSDGLIIELSDKHEDLVRILQKSAPEKELPWKAI